jgi:cohesin complex subunit SA-1/2
MMDQEEQDARDDNEKDSEDDGDSNDNDESPRKNKKRQTSRKGKSDSTKTAGTSRKTGKAQVKVRTSTIHKLTNTAQRGKGAGGRNVFVALAKRVLEEDETLETSLTAAILDAGKKSAQSTQASLENMARKIIQKHRDDANATQVELINLIFRSVGGSTASFLEDGTDLEDMDGDKWANVITNLVDDMRYTAPDCVLICSDPEGAQHAVAVASNKVSKDSTSYQPLSEYRKLYEQFWHTLAEVALQQTGRFAIEMVRDWIMCVNELLEVCQPDIRAAAVAASLAMTIVMLDRTVALRDKMETASRQFQAATKNRGDSNTKLSTKAESLKHQVDSLKRSIQDLEETVESNVTAVFVNRYRDSDEHIRAANIRALAKMTLLRPDLYLCDRFLKYMGWTLSDTAVTVRLAALEGLAAPFQAKSRKIDIGRMSNVIRKFLPRLADCTIDVDVRVQEKAMALFLLLDRANFLEDLEDDLLWEQVNIRALAQDTSPNVRRDALYFVIDQLEAFDNAEDEEEDKKQSRSKSWSKDKNASLVQSSDNAASKKLGALAEW